MGTSPVESRLVEIMEQWLQQHGFLTVKELQLTDKYLNIALLTQKVRKQRRVRIDLAAYHPLDQSIHFIEAESDLHVFHPTLYARFAHHVYLLCPEESITRHEPELVRQQFRYAKEWGMGIITINHEGKIRSLVDSRRREPDPLICHLLLQRFGVKSS